MALELFFKQTSLHVLRTGNVFGRKLYLFDELFKIPALQTNGLHCSGSKFVGFLICSVMHHLLKENKSNYSKVDRRS